MEKTFRQCAIDYIKNRHLCKGYVDYIVSQLDKLDKIEEIVNRELIAGKHDYQSCYQTFFEIADIVQK